MGGRPRRQIDRQVQLEPRVRADAGGQSHPDPREYRVGNVDHPADYPPPPTALILSNCRRAYRQQDSRSRVTADANGTTVRLMRFTGTLTLPSWLRSA